MMKKPAKRVPLDASRLYHDLFETIQRAAGWDPDDDRPGEEIDGNTVLQALVSVTACFIAAADGKTLFKYLVELRDQVKLRKEADAKAFKTEVESVEGPGSIGEKLDRLNDAFTRRCAEVGGKQALAELKANFDLDWLLNPSG